MSRSRLVVTALALALAATSTGCRVAYLPGEQPAAAPADDPAALRRAVRVLPSACTAREARATVSNRSDKALDVTVEVAWATPDGGSTTATGNVTAGPRRSVELTVAAPPGATADVGCQASKRAVAIHR